MKIRGLEFGNNIYIAQIFNLPIGFDEMNLVG